MAKMSKYILVKCREPLTVKDLEGLMDDPPGLVIKGFDSEADALASLVNDPGWSWVIIGVETNWGDIVPTVVRKSKRQ